MPPSLEEVVYDLARDALAEQRELVAGLRSRAAPLLAGAGALAALLAEPAIGDGVSFAADPLHAGLVVVGILGAVAALLGAILVLATRDFGFSVDADRLYRAAYPDRDQPDVFLVRLAESHHQRPHREPSRCPRPAALPPRRPRRRRSRGRRLRDRARRTLRSMATTPQSAPKPAPAAPAPQPPKVEPYPNIFFVEGKAQDLSGERRSS